MDRLVKLLQALHDTITETWLNTVLEILQHVHKLGLPPSIKEKENFRHWLNGLLPALDAVAEATKTEIDNQAATLVRVALENDQAWDALYALLYVNWFPLESRLLVDPEESVAGGQESQSEVCAMQAGISPFTVIEIVKLLVRIIELLKS